MDLIRKFLTPAGRKAIYAVAAGVFAVLVVLGVIDAAQGDQWLSLLDKLLGFVVTFLAAAKTSTKTDSGMPPNGD